MPIAPGSIPRTHAIGERDLVERIRRGLAPYEAYTPEIEPGLSWYMYRRNDDASRGAGAGVPSGP